MTAGNGQLEVTPEINADQDGLALQRDVPSAVVPDAFFNKVDKSGLLIALVVASFCFFFRLGAAGVCDGSESYYPAAAREMVEAGNYLVPQLNYQLYFTKPILMFWMVIGGFKLFGPTAFGGRFFAALFAVGLSSLTYFTTRAVSNSRAAFLAALIVVASPLMLDYARLSGIDLFFSCWLALSFFSTLLVVCGGRKNFWPFIYVGLSLALLTKGPASLVIYAAASLFALALQWKDHRSKFWQALKAIKPLYGIPIIVAIVLPWWVYVWQATDGAFPTYFWVYENIGRAAGHTNSNPGYWFRYPITILVGLFPWSLLLPGFLWRTFRSIAGRDRALPDANGMTAVASLNEAGVLEANQSSLLDAKRWALGCGLAVITLFSLSRTQMETYLLPMVAPLAVYIALSFNDWLTALKEKAGDSVLTSRWTKVVSAMILAVGFVFAVGGFALPAVFKLSVNQFSWPLVALPLAGLIVCAAMTLQFILLRTGQVQKGFIAMAMIYALGMGVGVEAGIEAWYGTSMRDLHYLCTLLDDKPGQVAFYADLRPSALFYAKRPVYFFYQADRLVPYSAYKFKLPEQALKFPLYVLSERKNLKALTSVKDVTFTTVAEKGKWGLYEVGGARLEPYETLINTFKNNSLADLATKQLPTGPLTVPYGGGTFKHNALDPFQYR